jgi:hypothetical protein
VAINLLKLLSRFDEVSDRETEHAYSRTLVPSVAEYGYLNIVYKPQAPGVVAAGDTALRLPATLLAFYAAWNGARLFFDVLSIRGCLPSGQRYNRSDPFAVLPFDLRESDRSLACQLDEAGVIRIGTYNSDGSAVCMQRDSRQVECYIGKDLARPRERWSSLDEWLISEISRLSLFFDSAGKALISNDRLLLPGSGATPD